MRVIKALPVVGCFKCSEMCVKNNINFGFFLCNIKATSLSRISDTERVAFLRCAFLRVIKAHLRGESA